MPEIAVAENRKGDRRAIPERIADAIDYDISAQRLPIGERLVEIQLAERFGVGRGSVRDALRLLAHRGSVQLKPGRGAVVCGYSLERLADAFAAAGILIALGARYLARHRPPSGLTRLRERLERLERLIAGGMADPLEFATAIGGVDAAIIVGSGSHYVRSQVSAILNRSVWRAMWEHPCDHLTAERQRDEVESLRRIVALIDAGDADAAEIEVRAFHQAHCEHVVAEMARQREERAPECPPLAFTGSPDPRSNGLERRVADIEMQIGRLAAGIRAPQHVQSGSGGR